jgi:hypothetical protein
MVRPDAIATAVKKGNHKQIIHANARILPQLKIHAKRRGGVNIMKALATVIALLPKNGLI